MAEKLSTGLDKNTAAALSYVVFFVSGLFFFIFEKDPFVRFHAMQSIIVFGFLFVLQWFFTLSIIFVPINSLVVLVSFVLWLILIYKAWSGEMWEVPILGTYVKKALAKFRN